MRILKKVLIIAAIAIITIVNLRYNNYIATAISTQLSPKTPVRIGLFSRDLNDDYIASLRENFEEIQKSNEGKVVFTFYNSNFNQATQNSDIDRELREGIDLILLDMVDVKEVNELINKIAQYNVPVIFFNREPFTLDAIKSYKKSLFVGTDSKQAGTLQGKMIVDAWNRHKDSIDKNKDNVLQYLLLSGEMNNKIPIDRSEYSILTIQQAGIQTEELASKPLHWDTEVARTTVEALFLRYGSKIEAIISNDDSMAIGAVEALQKYGYNTGDKSKLIPVVGIDATPEAKELISKGIMLGSPEHNPLDLANAIYTIGMNLVSDRNPIEGTPYNLDETGAAVRIPYKEYTGSMFK